ncbi:hypothetical protein BGZ46_002020 [Entomortierella lignicola]|nr:hypothetical protein BGZ46_002020 [Entomortierella lignicola]
MIPATWKPLQGNALRNAAMVTASIRSGIKPNTSISIVRSVGLRNYTAATPCTNTVRQTLYNSSNYGTHQSRLSNLHPSSLVQNYGASFSTKLSPSRFSLVIRRGFANNSNNATTTTTTVAAPAKKSSGMMDKIKGMIKKYGYTGVAVYLGISTLDLAATFVLVKALGMEKIEVAQDWVVDHIGSYFGYKRDPTHIHHHYDGKGDEAAAHDLDKVGDEQLGAIYNKASGLWSVFLIAYGIHKLLVPLRVVATSMITPPLVKWLVKRGWIKETVKKGAVATNSTSAKVVADAAKR